MRNGLEMAVALYAGMAARGEVAPLNPTYTDREIEPAVRDIELRLIVCEAEFAGRAKAARGLIGNPDVIALSEPGITVERRGMCEGMDDGGKVRIPGIENERGQARHLLLRAVTYVPSPKEKGG